MLLGDARLPAIQQLERSLHRFADRALGGRSNAVTLVEGLIDGAGKFGVWHETPQCLVDR